MTSAGVVRLSEVRIEGVGKRAGREWAVADVTISVRPGELYTLLGPPGSGPSTLIAMVAGLLRPDVGRILVNDEPVDHLPPQRRGVGLVPTGGALWPHLSVGDNVAFGLSRRGVGEAERRRRVGAALEQVGLPGAEARRPRELSGAEPHRVAIARALVVQPRLLLLDDPMAGLDAALRVGLRLDVARLQKEVGVTTLHATADHAEALALATRIAVLSAGRVAQEGRPDEIYWRPRSRAVAQSVGAANLVPVRVLEVREMGVVVATDGGAQLPVASGGHAWTVGARGTLCLRPEALVIEEAERARGGIPGTVAGYAFEGGRQLYDVAIPGATLRVEALTSAAQARGFKHGDHVRVEVQADSAILLPEEAGPGG
jgi:ABC-type Fe3+/spermidine/putrescine transport system ATPase subunit